MSLARRLSDTVSRLKGESYTIDERIDGTYLLWTVWQRVVMRVRGRILFLGCGAAPFVGAGARVRARRRIRAGRGVTLGQDSYIDAMSVDGVALGENTSVGRNTRIECTGSLRTLGKGLTVGDNVGLGTDNFYGCAGGVTIGDDTIIGSSVSFHSENHVVSDPAVPIRLQGVTHSGISVGRNCWIGARVTVLDGAVIGDGAVIAAGAVVAAGRYDDNSVYGGIPARLLKRRTAGEPCMQDLF